MEITRDNILWFAGLFEGEGCLTACQHKDKNIPTWNMVVNMTDEDVIKKIHQLFGGRLYFYESKNPKHKDKWTWKTGELKKIYALVVAMIPFMGGRRRAKMEEFILDFASRPANSSEATKAQWRNPEYRDKNLMARKLSI